jgi:hypothetical protein
VRLLRTVFGLDSGLEFELVPVGMHCAVRWKNVCKANRVARDQICRISLHRKAPKLGDNLLNGGIIVCPCRRGPTHWPETLAKNSETS